MSSNFLIKNLRKHCFQNGESKFVSKLTKMVVKIVYGVSVTHNDVCKCSENEDEHSETDMEEDQEHEQQKENEKKPSVSLAISEPDMKGESDHEPDMEGESDHEHPHESGCQDGNRISDDQDAKTTTCKCPDIWKFDSKIKLTKNIMAINIDSEWNAIYNQTKTMIDGDMHMIFGVSISELNGQYGKFMVIDEDFLPNAKTKHDFQKFMDANPILKGVHPKLMVIEEDEE